jgi:hypothetical protein
MFLELGSPQLTHKLLVTLMAEITGIINSRPIAVVPSDIDQPEPLTPNMLLTMKTRPLLPPPGVFTPEMSIHIVIGRKEQNGTNDSQI